MKYFIANNGQQTGPFELNELLLNGLTNSSYVWNETMTNWAPVSQVPEVAALLKPNTPPQFAAQPPQTQQQAYQQPNYQQQYQQPTYQQQPAYQQPYQSQWPAGYAPKDKIVAALLAFFLGGLGIHNFYLGYTGKGVAQLLISLLLGWLVVPLIIVGIWVLVEFVMILVGNIKDAKGYPLK